MVSGFATWVRDINFSLPAGQSSSYQDFAQFGGGVTWNLPQAFSKNLKFVGNYSYTAFNSSYFSHLVSLGLQLHF
jgi:hypothetical protein